MDRIDSEGSILRFCGLESKTCPDCDRAYCRYRHAARCSENSSEFAVQPKVLTAGYSAMPLTVFDCKGIPATSPVSILHATRQESPGCSVAAEPRGIRGSPYLLVHARASCSVGPRVSDSDRARIFGGLSSSSPSKQMSAYLPPRSPQMRRTQKRTDVRLSRWNTATSPA